jgi:hypothetical protein
MLTTMSLTVRDLHAMQASMRRLDSQLQQLGPAGRSFARLESQRHGGRLRTVGQVRCA